MTEQQKKVDAYLAMACSRLLNAGYVLNRMRELNRQDLPLDYWRQAVTLGDHLTVGGHALTEAHRILLAEQGISMQTEGGLVN